MLVPGHCHSGFRLEEQVGVTPVAHLWRATDIRRGTVRGLRVLSPDARPYLDAFLADAAAQRVLTHQNRVSLLDVVEIEGLPALVTEHIGGPSLQTWTRIRSRTVNEILGVFQDIVKGVASAHSFDLYHLHLDSSQIWMNPRRGAFVPKVDLAFGTMAAAGLRLGRLRAPEQALGRKVDQRADLFLLGAVLYELLAGRPPFEDGQGKSHPALVPGSWRPLGEVRTDLPPGVAQLVGRLLSPAPDDRPDTAEQILQILAQVGEDPESSSASAPARIASAGSRPGASPELTLVPASDLTPVSDPRESPLPSTTKIPRWAVASMVAAGLLSIVGALFVTLGG